MIILLFLHHAMHPCLAYAISFGFGICVHMLGTNIWKCCARDRDKIRTDEPMSQNLNQLFVLVTYNVCYFSDNFFLYSLFFIEIRFFFSRAFCAQKKERERETEWFFFLRRLSFTIDSSLFQCMVFVSAIFLSSKKWKGISHQCSWLLFAFFCIRCSKEKDSKRLSRPSVYFFLCCVCITSPISICAVRFDFVYTLVL